MDNVDKLSTKDIRDYTSLELAFIGDAIWELEIRKHYLQFGYNIPTLNKYVKNKVNARYQSLIYKQIIEELDEEFKVIGKRAKNSSFPFCFYVIRTEVLHHRFDLLSTALTLADDADALFLVEAILYEDLLEELVDRHATVGCPCSELGEHAAGRY